MGKVFNLWKVGSLNIAMAMLKYSHDMVPYLLKTLSKTPERNSRKTFQNGQSMRTSILVSR